MLAAVETQEVHLEEKADALSSREPVTESSEQSPLDYAALKNIRALQREGAPDIVARVVSQYLEDAPRLLYAMREAVPTGNMGELRTAAHSLKSSSANVGANRLAELCKHIEMKARQNTIDRINTEVDNVEMEFERARAALLIAAQGQH